MRDELELINQLATQFGIIQTILAIMAIAVAVYIVYNARSTNSLARGHSTTMTQTGLLLTKLEDNNAKSDERWHDRMERTETSRTETATLINSLQSELREVTNNNSYGKGVIDTLTATYKEYREKAEADKVAMLGEIDLLKRQVAENKRTIQELLKSSALKDKVIAEKDERLAALELENSKLKLQLAKLKEANNKPQLPTETSNK